MGGADSTGRRVGKMAPEWKVCDYTTWEAIVFIGGWTERVPAETICKKVASATVTKRRQKSDCLAAKRNKKQTQLTQRLQGHKCQALPSVPAAVNYKRVFPGKDSRSHISVIAQEITCQHIISEHKGQDDCPKFCQPKVPVI